MQARVSYDVRKSLRLLAARKDTTVSDEIRQAVVRHLEEEQ